MTTQDFVAQLLINSGSWLTVLAVAFRMLYVPVIRPLLQRYLSDRTRQLFYDAIKVGLRVAQGNGLTADELIGTAVEKACAYLERFSGVNIPEDQIRDAVIAEIHKLWQEEQKLAGILGTPPELTPSPASTSGKPSFQLLDKQA